MLRFTKSKSNLQLIVELWVLVDDSNFSDDEKVYTTTLSYIRLERGIQHERMVLRLES